MWLVGYWMEHGYSPETICALSGKEKAVWQAIAELNQEKHKQDMKDAIIEAICEIVKAFNKK